MEREVSAIEIDCRHGTGLEGNWEPWGQEVFIGEGVGVGTLYN